MTLWIGKKLRSFLWVPVIIFTPIFLFSIFGKLWREAFDLFLYFFIGYIILFVIAYFATFGVDKTKKKNASERLRAKTGEELVAITDAYHGEIGHGTLVLSKGHVSFITKDDVYCFPINCIAKAGLDHKGTGIYETSHSRVGSFKFSNTTESKMKVFYMSGNLNGKSFTQEWQVYNANKFFKQMSEFQHFIKTTGLDDFKTNM